MLIGTCLQLRFVDDLLKPMLLTLSNDAANVELKKQVKCVESENIASGAMASQAKKLEIDVASLQHDLVTAMSDLQEPHVESSEMKKDLELKGKENREKFASQNERFNEQSNLCKVLR